MPEGHSVHRIALQFERDFVGRAVSVSSPQGRFAEGATLIDGHRMTEARAVGKQMFLKFDNGLWLRIHLGIYGAWDFFGTISAITDEKGRGRSIGAPRRRRAIRMAETEHTTDDPDAPELFPPDPVGAVRVRLLTDESVADLRGPTACEVIDEAEVATVLERLGPDPANENTQEAEDRFVERLRKRRVAVGQLLMDQSVASGIGNVYRAELLFRARLNPHTPGNQVSDELAREIWRDWVGQLEIGIRTGMMLTMEGSPDATDEERKRARRSRADRYWVYKREGLPCRICGTHIVMEIMAARKLYWCPGDQA